MPASYRLKTRCFCCLKKGLQVARSTQGQSISIQSGFLSHNGAVFTWAWLSKRGSCNSVAGGQGSLHKRLSGESEPWARQTGLMEPSPYALFESVSNNCEYKEITDGSLDYKTHIDRHHNNTVNSLQGLNDLIMYHSFQLFKPKTSHCVLKIAITTDKQN